MLICEGHKMFYGDAEITPKNRPPFVVTGTWLFDPDRGCWYCNGSSYPESVVGNIAERDKPN